MTNRRSTVHARDVLRAVHELERRGSARIIDQLDEEAPELNDHLTESLGMIHREILNLGGPARASRRTYRRVEDLVLVCVLALRHSHDQRRGRGEEPAEDIDE